MHTSLCSLLAAAVTLLGPAPQHLDHHGGDAQATPAAAAPAVTMTGDAWVITHDRTVHGRIVLDELTVEPGGRLIVRDNTEIIVRGSIRINGKVSFHNATASRPHGADLALIAADTIRVETPITGADGFSPAVDEADAGSAREGGHGSTIILDAPRIWLTADIRGGNGGDALPAATPGDGGSVLLLGHAITRQNGGAWIEGGKGGDAATTIRGDRERYVVLGGNGGWAIASAYDPGWGLRPVHEVFPYPDRPARSAWIPEPAPPGEDGADGFPGVNARGGNGGKGSDGPDADLDAAYIGSFPGGNGGRGGRAHGGNGADGQNGGPTTDAHPGGAGGRGGMGGKGLGGTGGPGGDGGDGAYRPDGTSGAPSGGGNGNPGGVGLGGSGGNGGDAAIGSGAYGGPPGAPGRGEGGKQGDGGKGGAGAGPMLDASDGSGGRRRANSSNGNPGIAGASDETTER